MEFTKNDMKMSKGVAILLMLLLHLFCRKEVNGLYETSPLINGVPLMYYIGLFGDACVPIYCFASGYGLFLSIKNAQGEILKKNVKRILKLLINYWIILVLFVSLGFFVGDTQVYPGSLTKFLLNFFVISSSYNGAWWFMQTYIILVILSPVLTKIINKYNSYFIIFISGIIYLFAYIQRIKHTINFGDNSVISMIINSIVLVGTSQLPYIVGSIFAKERIYSKIFNAFSRLTLKNYICLAIILLLLLFHSFYESMIIAPITGITFICVFILIDKKVLINKIFKFFGDHSTNIWLTHMFFYLTIFPKMTFEPYFPILIFCWLLIMCLISSFIIHLIYKPIIHYIDNKINNVHYIKKDVI
ncbi:acyltransferase [Bacillus sp. EB600]|uniref:acyltransferase family protein n=1 Tax=Bacillus sp. EB600 TaxID=2806345 RepID=UPI00210985E3|nr:acyltransferase [Bacillus sp. EB600]MCQ6278882.1 acyltransferase [Bacillus sp. EB600]